MNTLYPIIDLFCTNQLEIVQNIYTSAGISDHDIPFADCNVKFCQNKKKRRKKYNYETADWDKIKEESSIFKETFLNEYMNNNVEINWKKFKHHINITMNKYIPSKLTSTRNNIPWLHTQLRRMIKKKQRMYTIKPEIH